MSWFDSTKTEHAKDAVKDLLVSKNNTKKLEEWKRKYDDKKDSEGNYTWWK